MIATLGSYWDLRDRNADAIDWNTGLAILLTGHAATAAEACRALTPEGVSAAPHPRRPQQCGSAPSSITAAHRPERASRESLRDASFRERLDDLSAELDRAFLRQTRSTVRQPR